jgi:NAD(P)-dependent dehydrogenase (short-subunit alcohol dehydrogenase family)
MKHALVIGGTGMLKDVVLKLAEEYDVVSVIAKNSFGLNALWEDAYNMGLKINPLQLDYRDNEDLLEVIQEAIKTHGNITLVISWIKMNAPDAINIITSCLESQNCEIGFYDILSTVFHKNPEIVMAHMESMFDEHSWIKYHNILLDMSDIDRKWPSNEHISHEIMKAIESNAERYEVDNPEG